MSLHYTAGDARLNPDHPLFGSSSLASAGGQFAAIFSFGITFAGGGY